MSWFDRLKNGLKKTSDKISDGISSIIYKKKLDEESLLELEDLLISADLGVTSSKKIIKELSRLKFNKEVDDTEIKSTLSQIITENLSNYASDIKFSDAKPHVVLMCGVNGNGKTTTVGKLAFKLHQEGKKVTIGACDTFRAAALEQLEVWSKRAKSELVHGLPNSDPASVAFQAFKKAQENGSDVLFLDTAGRLSNKAHLMEELAKIVKVLKKINPDAPHDGILVLDATTGQNALSQVESFKNTLDLTGLIITKLDGSAKAGIVIALAEKFDIPIVSIGVGEAIEDLDSFNPKEFAENLVGLKK